MPRKKQIPEKITNNDSNVSSPGMTTSSIILIIIIIAFGLLFIIDYDKATSKLFGWENSSYFIIDDGSYPFKVVKREPGYKYEYKNGKVYRSKDFTQVNFSTADSLTISSSVDQSSIDYSNNEINKDNIDLPIIDPNVAASVDDSKFIKRLDLDDNYINKIKIILSDSEDPENKNRSYCDDYEVKCKWCSKAFFTKAEYISIHSLLNRFLLNPFGITAMIITDMGNPGEAEETVKKLCNMYYSGIKYSCELPLSRNEFCSIKCEKEYDLNH